MSKIKIEEVALEAGTSDKIALEKAKELGFKVRAKNSTINEEQAMMLMDYIISGKLPKELSKEKTPKKSEVEKENKTEPKVQKEAKAEPSKEEKKEEEKPKAPKKLLLQK